LTKHTFEGQEVGSQLANTEASHFDWGWNCTELFKRLAKEYHL